MENTKDKTPADIEPATGFDPSGAPMQTVPDVDPAHPAADNDPRAGTSPDQNRIDFNDPRPDKGAEAVAKALSVQGVPTAVDPLDHDRDGRKGGSLPKAK